jgi:hypothetical protein
MAPDYCRKLTDHCAAHAALARSITDQAEHSARAAHLKPKHAQSKQIVRIPGYNPVKNGILAKPALQSVHKIQEPVIASHPDLRISIPKNQANLPQCAVVFALERSQSRLIRAHAPFLCVGEPLPPHL